MSMIIAMFIYAFSMSVTPGPINLVSLSTGVNHGWKKNIPFALSSSFSLALLLCLIMFGLGKVAAENPMFLKGIAILGCAFISYIGFKVSFSDRIITMGKEGKFPRYGAGFVVIWVNPKVWVATLAGVSAFNLPGNPQDFVIFTMLYVTMAFFITSAWAYLGTKISILLKTPAHVKNFNHIMGACLILIAIYLLISQGYLVT